MNEPTLISASVALTIAVTRALSASLICMVLPSLALTVSIEPSTFSIVPRMRTGGVCGAGAGAGAWANATDVANKTPTAAAPIILRVIVVMIIILPTCSQFAPATDAAAAGF